jgi:hypothetical protein
MSNTLPLPSPEAAKLQAKRLRKALHAEGNFISHSESLEFLAKQHGFRDWNTFRACLPSAAADLAVGQPVEGRYLGQAFKGELLGLQRLKGDRQKVVIELDEPVDVVRSPHFSSLRKRVTGVLERNRASYEKTSDGQPVLALS